MRFAFTSTPGASFTVLTSTNVTLPCAEWSVLGAVVETVPGQFQFTDPPTTNTAHRFFLIRWP